MSVDEKAAQASTGGVQREGTSWVLEPDRVPRTIRYQIGSQRCLSLVQPPTHWNVKREMLRSGQLPQHGLQLEHVYGYGGRGGRAPDCNGYTSPVQRLFFNSQNWLMYEVAQLGVALSTPMSTPKESENDFEQKFFVGHNTDITCLTVDPMGVFVATGQVTFLHLKLAYSRILLGIRSKEQETWSIRTWQSGMHTLWKNWPRLGQFLQN